MATSLYLERRRNLLNLILVVLIFGTLSGILTSIFFTLPSAGSLLPWIVTALLVIAAISSYTLVLIPEVVEAAIYANILIDNKSHQLYESRFASPASQLVARLFGRISQDDKSLGAELINDIESTDRMHLAGDLLEFIVLFALSGFDPFWASRRVQTFGRPNWSGRPLGEKLSYRPTSILMLGEAPNKENIESGFPIIDISDQFHQNRIFEHFRATKPDTIYEPSRWMIWVPKRIRLAVTRDNVRTIAFRDFCAQLTVTLSRAGVGFGLPYGISNKESNYNELDFSTSDFRLDYRFELRQIGRILSFLPMIDSYVNWSDKVMRNLISLFALKD